MTDITNPKDKFGYHTMGDLRVYNKIETIKPPFQLNSKDKFGYYTVDDFKTYSKIEAVETADRTKRLVKWHFNDFEYSNYNWKIEPTETLDELYARRAWQIRKDYDYVVILYSGGIDSQNIVDTFIKNNIPIDELATLDYHQLDPRPDSHFHAEHTYVTYPAIKMLKDKGIRFRHRAIDLSEISRDVLLDPKWDADRPYYGNTHSSVMHISKTYIRERTKDYMDIIDSGKKLVLVWGCDKPRLKIGSAGNLEVEFVDTVGSAVGIRTQMLNREWEHDECFYWAPETCDIICKQIHILKRFIQTNQFFSLVPKLLLDDKIDDPVLLKFLGDRGINKGLVYRNILNWLIYTNFNWGMFSTGKPPLTIANVYSPRDECWHKDIVFRRQSDLVAQYYHTIGKHWLRNPDTPAAGMKIFGIRYPI
jgi:hypothetical protein